MKSFLGVYYKRELISRQATQIVIDHFLNGKNKQKITEHKYDHLYLAQHNYSSSPESELVIGKSLYGFNGIMYPPFPPASNGIDLSEQILHYFEAGYNKTGYDSFKQLKGKYNAYIYNTERHELILVNDPLGMNPLFYYEDEEVFIFCTEYEALSEFAQAKQELDIDAIFEYFIFGAPQNNNTFFQKIKLLPPGSLFTFCGEKKLVTPIYERINIQPNQSDIEEIADRYFITFKAELKLLLKWYPDLPVTLTGGTDTRIILGAMDEDQRRKRKFFTFTSRVVENFENQDVLISNMLAKEFGLQHSILEKEFYAITTLDDDYFNNVRNNSDFFVSGFLGSETLRFSPSYPNNISEISRSIISSTYNKYDDAHDFLFPMKKGFTNSKKISFAEKSLREFFNKTYRKNVKITPSNLFKSIEHASGPYPEIIYTDNYLIRCFFSRHCGGAKSNVIMPVHNSQHFVSPFAIKELLQIIWSINPQYLYSNKDGISNRILKDHLPEFCKVESNSHLTDYDGTILKKFTSGRHTVDYNAIKYPSFNDICKDNFDYLYSIFDLKKVKRHFFDKNNPYMFVWADLFIWINYLHTI